MAFNRHLGRAENFRERPHFQPPTQHDDKFQKNLAKAEILREMVARLETKHDWFIWEVSFAELITLLGFLQIACTHPDIDEYQKKYVTGQVHRIFAVLEASEPGITSLLLNKTGGEA